jgi:hypothetical protein
MSKIPLPKKILRLFRSGLKMHEQVHLHRLSQLHLDKNVSLELEVKKQKRFLKNGLRINVALDVI